MATSYSAMKCIAMPQFPHDKAVTIKVVARAASTSLDLATRWVHEEYLLAGFGVIHVGWDYFGCLNDFIDNHVGNSGN